ncbi:MAG TPA: signal peptidase I [Sphingomicrobium sp.]
MRRRTIILAAVVAVAAGATLWMVSGVPVAGIRTFYIPSEAMEPTLEKGDHFVAAMVAPRDLHRGEILLVRTSGGNIYTKRLAALAGDRIALARGTVSINGHPVGQVAAGTRRVAYPYLPATEARLFREQFPGEPAPHLVQDLGPSSEDDMAELTVAPGHLFLLGDNRDDSADSRVPKMMGGLEQVPISDVIGHPMFLYWPPRKAGSAPDAPGK